MFQLSLRMTARQHHAAEVVKALKSITISAQVERGFLGSRIYQEVGAPEVLCLEEDWSHEAELKSHICSGSFTDLLLLMETASAVPVLEVRVVSAVRGLEYIEAVRFGDN
jgi:quinol monooxygenase YgiN